MSDRPPPLAPPNPKLPTFATLEDRRLSQREFMERIESAVVSQGQSLYRGTRGDNFVTGPHGGLPRFTHWDVSDAAPCRISRVREIADSIRSFARGGLRWVRFPVMPSFGMVSPDDPFPHCETIQTIEVDLSGILRTTQFLERRGLHSESDEEWLKFARGVVARLDDAGRQLTNRRR